MRKLPSAAWPALIGAAVTLGVVTVHVLELLSYAVHAGGLVHHPVLARLFTLLAAGADPTVRLHPERRRTSPRGLAVSRGHHRIAGLLGEPKRRFRRPFSGLMIPDA